MRIRRSARLVTGLAIPLAIAFGCETRDNRDSEASASAAALGVPPQSDQDKTLYALGAMMGRTLERFSLTESEWVWVAQGAADRALGRETAVDPESHQAQIQAMFQERTGPSPESLAVHQKFLDEQASSEGAQRTASGLIITELVAGSGESPGPTDAVEVHYHGTLPDGTVFDSSVDRDQRANFPLNRVIPCWTEGVGLMKVGGKSRLVCPAEIAYGPRGSGKIPPNSPIVFEVELFSIGN
jgi:FKBP-type peptidyl-prolyl cis-trans isomerase FkpA